MLQRLDFWLAVVVLALFAYWELHLDRIINPLVRSIVDVAWPAAEEVAERAKHRASRHLPTAVHLRSRPIRDDGGRFNGSLPAHKIVTSGGNDPQPSLHDVAASGRGVADGNDVAEVTVSSEEMMLISLRLGQGMSPSAVVKSLPGYSPRKNYDLYKTKVEQVQSALARLAPAEETQDTA